VQPLTLQRRRRSHRDAGRRRCDAQVRALHRPPRPRPCRAVRPASDDAARRRAPTRARSELPAPRRYPSRHAPRRHLRRSSRPRLPLHCCPRVSLGPRSRVTSKAHDTPECALSVYPVPRPSFKVSRPLSRAPTSRRAAPPPLFADLIAAALPLSCRSSAVPPHRFFRSPGADAHFGAPRESARARERWRRTPAGAPTPVHFASC